MNFLKKLFQGDGVERDDRAAYFYVQPHRCDDVMRVRVDLMNDLSQRDDADGLWTRKLASSGNYRCNQVELVLYFDKNRRLVDSEVQGGKMVDRAAYDAWMETQTAEQE